MGDVSTKLMSGVAREYAPDEERPLGGYLALMGVYTAVVGAAAAVARASGRHLPERISFGDLALVTVATHKIARLAAKDVVTTPLRATFTKFEGSAGEAEINESPRGHGLRRALGELVTCPFCVGLWVATGLVGGLALAPKPTRLVAATATALAGSDVLQFGYDALKRTANKDA
jgi:Protein of unknown function (DUF1360)